LDVLISTALKNDV